jgi:hypothetical protein
MTALRLKITRSEGLRLFGPPASVHFGHHHVCKQKSDVLVAIQQPQASQAI